MRNPIMFVLSFAALFAAAVTLDVARLPEPSFSDREISEDAALPANRLDLLRVFRLEMTFESTPSNNVQVAFGRDNRPRDGKLAAEETDFIIGWDRGEWFLRPQGLRERYAFSPAAVGGTRTLTAEIRVNAQGTPLPAVFRDGGAVFTFPGFALSPVPGWLRPGLWDCMRVTVRGGTNGTVRARFLRDGATVILK